MTRFRLWAPLAEQVELVALGERFRMQRDASGHHVLDEPRLLPGTDYAFSLDGRAPLPDPRSGHQPQGVHGASRVPEESFDWTDRAFRATPLEFAVIYELHVGTFAADGTFDGVIERLPHLEALGVTHVELMPIAEFPGARGWGYDGVDLYAPHSAYGGPSALRRLVDACHARGIAVLLDVVYNHLGPDGNYLPRFAPYLSPAQGTPWGLAVNLDGPEAEGVRRFFIENALTWLRDFHVDGLRLDAIHALRDASARHFLRELAEEVRALSEALGRPLVLIGESDTNDPRPIHAWEKGGYGLDALWSDDFHHALHAVISGERQAYYADYGSLSLLARALSRGFAFAGEYSAFRRRAYGEPLDPGLSLRRLVCFMQNHDQVGNRARGERIGKLAPEARVRLGAVLLLLGPFIPMLFQGEEWNAKTPFLYFTDHGDPGLGRAVREGRERELQVAFGGPVPDPQDVNTFSASRLDFGEITEPPHAAMLAFYRELIALRKSRPELVRGDVDARADEARGVLVVRREQSVIIVNFGEEAVLERMPRVEGRSTSLILGSEGARLHADDVFVPPNGFAVCALS